MPHEAPPSEFATGMEEILTDLKLDPALATGLIRRTWALAEKIYQHQPCQPILYRSTTLAPGVATTFTLGAIGYGGTLGLTNPDEARALREQALRWAMEAMGRHGDSGVVLATARAFEAFVRGTEKPEGSGP